MFSFFSNFFEKKSIDTFGILPLSDCRIVRPYLLERADIQSGSVILFAVPYAAPACFEQNRNISAYAVSRDYHLYFKELFDELLPLLKERFPKARFAAYADHSPIAEVEAAEKAGLGVIGRNRLLLTEKYSSYIFLGEIFTDLETDCTAREIRICMDCGACANACPMDRIGTCLSALTQKKGALTEQEEQAIFTYQSAWGCDLCQEHCPYTQKAIQSGTIFSPIPFFNEQTNAHLLTQDVLKMGDTAFSERAYAWRGKETLLRNLRILEAKHSKGDPPC